MLRITEAFRRIVLGILFKRLVLSANQTGDLRFPPALTDRVNAWSAVRMPATNPTTIAFDDRQRRRKITLQSKGIAGFQIGIATFREFSANLMDHSFDRLRRHGNIRFGQRNYGSFVGTSLPRQDRDFADDFRCQLA